MIREKNNEDLAKQSPGFEGRGDDYIFKSGEITHGGKTIITAREWQREAGERESDDNKGKMERNAYVFALIGRAQDLSKELSAVEELLREQYAICESNRPLGRIISTKIGDRVTVAPSKTLPGYSDSATRARRLLQRELREILGTDVEDTSELAPVRVHSPPKDYADRESDYEPEYQRRLDTLVRCRRGDVSERRGRRNNVSGTNWKDRIVSYVRALLGNTKSN